MCEGGGGAGKRIEAMRLTHGVDDKTPILIIPVSTQLLNSSDDVAGIIHWAKKHEAVMIVIDTLNRAMNGGEENSSKDMGDFIGSCDQIREATGAHVAVVHHNGTNKDKKGRGHSSLECAADTMVLVEKHSGGNTAKVTKNKDDEDGWSVGFRLEIVEVGTDEDGDPITSCAVFPADIIEAAANHRLTGDKATAWHALIEVMISDGRIIPDHTGIPDDFKCVEVEVWRQEFYARAADKPSQDAKQKAFKRAMVGLRDASRVGYRDNLVWIVDRDNMAGQTQT